MDGYCERSSPFSLPLFFPHVYSLINVSKQNHFETILIYQTENKSYHCNTDKNLGHRIGFQLKLQLVYL